jgi:hypothetical protein
VRHEASDWLLEGHADMGKDQIQKFSIELLFSWCTKSTFSRKMWKNDPMTPDNDRKPFLTFRLFWGNQVPRVVLTQEMTQRPNVS